MSIDNKHNFVEIIYKSIIDENIELYRDSYLDIKADPSLDNYGKNVVNLIKNLDTDEKETLLMIMKQVMIDTLSSIFNLIEEDGNIADVKLIYKGETINEDLQDAFLAYVEEL
ncbi:hypothetical protein [Bartonella sp. HY406]|uniref:hypothetical protein n=1 Tax=Bartonella sp. HY406 TaxID=2979331 RepID=UPI0021C5DFBF|nr:hypothetical protein [Bartonella sp. HY406]UXN04865.1 hypothetical protein N6B01_14245 [Bartonella sp. HY406]